MCRAGRGFCRPVEDARPQSRLYSAVRPARRAQAPEGRGAAQARPLFLDFGIAFGRAARDPAIPSGLLSIKRHPVTVSAGPGAIVTEELGKPYFAFDERWLKALTPSAPANLSIVRVEGDSMAPTLNAGDDILVDLGDAGQRLRDGIYVLRIDDALVVKRARAQPARPADHDSVGQCGLSRLARLRARRDQLHRPGDLVGPARRLTGSAAIDQPQDDREERADCGAGENAFHGIADREAGDESSENEQGEEASSGSCGGALHRAAMTERVSVRPPTKHGQQAVDDVCRQSRNGRGAMVACMDSPFIHGRARAGRCRRADRTLRRRRRF